MEIYKASNNEETKKMGIPKKITSNLGSKTLKNKGSLDMMHRWYLGGKSRQISTVPMGAMLFLKVNSMPNLFT